jgi:AI-2 transport protein TqsA
MNKSIQYLVAAAATIIIIAGLKAGAGLISQILIALLLAFCISPLPEWLGHKGWPSGLALTVSFVLLIAVGFLTVVLLANSVSGLTESYPVYEQKLTEFYNKLMEFSKGYNVDISDLASKVSISPEKMVGYADKIVGSLTGMISSSFVILMLIVFLVIEMVGYDSDTRKGKRSKISLHNFFVSLGGDVRKYITITALKGVITGVLNFILLAILGVDFAFLWAFFSFFANFIPNIGFVLSFIPPALIALITLGPKQAIIVLIGFWFINFIVENVIGPIFMKQSLNISMLNSFLSLLVWGWILGVPGAILGIPLTMVVMKIYSEIGNESLQKS